MHLFMVGLDHTSATIAVREKLAFDEQTLTDALEQLTHPHNGHPALLREVVILSTCNRVEVYGVASHTQAIDNVVTFLAELHNLPVEQFAPVLRFLHTTDVLTHLFETAAGLRSIVLGEAQIQGQVRRAFLQAQRHHSVGPVLSRLFERALLCGKRVRHETHLGAGAASVSQASIDLAEQRLGSLEGCTVVLVGSGKVSELAAQNLLAHGARDLIVVNRTYEHGRSLAARYGAQAYTLNDLPRALMLADIVISSTSAPTPVIYREHIAEALRQRATLLDNQPHYVDSADVGSALTAELGAPMAARIETALHLEPLTEMLLIDLAVPRDIDDYVATLPGVHVYTVDDLQHVVSTTMAQRSTAVEAARTIVTAELDTAERWLRSQNALPVLSHWRQHAESLRAAEVERALRHLIGLTDAQQHVVEALSRSLVNKLLHDPTLRLRAAAEAGNGLQYADLLHTLWDFEE